MSAALSWKEPFLFWNGQLWSHWQSVQCHPVSGSPGPVTIHSPHRVPLPVCKHCCRNLLCLIFFLLSQRNLVGSAWPQSESQILLRENKIKHKWKKTLSKNHCLKICPLLLTLFFPHNIQVKCMHCSLNRACPCFTSWEAGDSLMSGLWNWIVWT